MKGFWRMTPSALVGFGGLAALSAAGYLSLERSVEPVVLGYSRGRFITILLVTLVGVSFLIASRSTAWSLRLLALVMGLGAALGLMEWFLWWSPGVIPVSFLSVMPERVVSRAVALDHQRSVNDPLKRFSFDYRSSSYVVDGYLRHYVPGLSGLLRTEDADDRWVHVEVDEIGFRNPPGLYSANETLDIVLLGDSFTRGTSRRTLAQFLADLTGLKVYSLADLGGAPQHWALAFERYGIRKTPRLVIVNFYEGNDLGDAVRLQEVMDKRLPLNLYYNRGLDRLSLRVVHESAALSFVFGALFIRHETPPNAIVRIGGSEQRLPLEHGSPGPLATEEPSRLVRDGLRLVERSLRRVKQSCACLLVLSYIPSVGSVYGDQAARITGTDDPQPWIQSPARQRALAGILSDVARRHGISFVDVTPELRRAATRERLYAEGHFSQVGYQRYAELLYDALRQAGLPRLDLGGPRIKARVTG